MILPTSVLMVLLIGSMPNLSYSGFMTFIGVSINSTGLLVVKEYSQAISDQSVPEDADARTAGDNDTRDYLYHITGGSGVNISVSPVSEQEQRPGHGKFVTAPATASQTGRGKMRK